MTKKEAKEYLEKIDKIELKLMVNEELTDEDKKLIFTLFRDERFKYSEIA